MCSNRHGMGLTQFLAEGSVVSTLVVEIDCIRERTGGDGDSSDGYSSRSLHGCKSEAERRVTDDHVSKLSERRTADRFDRTERLVAAGVLRRPRPTTIMSGTPRPTERELEEAFIKITFQDEREDQNKDPLYGHWTKQSRCRRSRLRIPGFTVVSSLRNLERTIYPRVSGLPYLVALMSLNPLRCSVSSLRSIYPGHTVVASQSGRASILSYPAAYVQSLRPDLMVSESVFVPFARRMGTPGVLVEQVTYGCFHVVWEVRRMFASVKILTDFSPEIHLQTLCHKGRAREVLLQPVADDALKFIQGYNRYLHQFIVHEGASEQPSKNLLIAAEGWAEALHDEVWVFNQGFWDKDPRMWQGVQDANWKDIILDEDFKTTLQKDVFGFFASERVYLELQIPWKVVPSSAALMKT